MVFWASRMARFDFFGALVDDEGGFFRAEGLDRGQKQGGPLGGGQGPQPVFRGFAGLAVGGLVIMLGAGLPDGMEQPVKAHPGRHPFGQALIARQKRRQRGPDMGVPAGLGTGQGPGVAAQIGQVRRKGLRHAHGKGSFGPNRKAQKRNLRQPKKFPSCRNHREIGTFGTLGRARMGSVDRLTRALPGRQTAYRIWCG